MAEPRPGELSKHRNLYFAIRDAIVTQKLMPEQRLPASRLLANDLGVSRNTVMSAYDQLTADGFLLSRKGVGTFVSDKLPRKLTKKLVNTKPTHRSVSNQSISARGHALMQTGRRNQAYGGPLFIPGMADVTHFPNARWNRIYNKYSRGMQVSDFGYEGGYLPLRNSISEYLRIARAVKCDPEQIMVTCGTNQALNFVIQMLTSPGDSAWIEEPGYHVAQATLQASLLKTEYVKLDQDGLVLKDKMETLPRPKVIYLTPSYQFPMGITMSLTRRMEILEFANQHDSWLFEDDYDSEFRYDTLPVASLQGLDNNDRVIYMGTFSKALSASLRLSYIVVPPQLVEHFKQGYQSLGNETTLITQAAINEFISAGHFESHIRKMRSLYAERREAIVAALTPYLNSQPGPAYNVSAGLHLTVPLSGSKTDKEIVEITNRENMGCRALSQYYAGNKHKEGLVLGYTSCDAEMLQNGVHRLMDVISREGNQIP